MFLGPWHEAYPKAKVLGPEGLPEKRDKQNNEKVPFSVIFTKENRETVKVDPEFDAEFDYEYMPSHMNKEIIFLYKPERTLITADLFFNLPATEQFSKTEESATAGIATKLFTYLNNTQGAALGQKRFLWYALSNGAKDRPGFNASVSKIAKWDFDRVIQCHGDVVEAGGKGIFEKLFEWNINAAKKGE
jgi:hypothetical protein